MSNILIKGTLKHFDAFYAMKCEYEKNIGSSKMLMKNGFIKTQQREMRELPLIKDASIFYLWRTQL